MTSRAALLCLAVLSVSDAVPVADEQDMFFRDAGPYVMGGTPAGTVPYMVALTTGVLFRGFVCGGSILSTRTVLTAAHCVEALGGSSPKKSLRGVVGTDHWNSGGVRYAFERGVVHADYDHNDIKNDIGLLITSSDILFSDYIQPVPLSTDFAGPGLNTTVAGWGKTAAGGFGSAVLLVLYPSIVDGEQCAADVSRLAAQLHMKAPAVDPAVEICAYLGAGHGVCHGDSGSALVSTGTGQQVGIVSWGLPCATGAPDIFTRTSAYEDWLTENTV